MFSALAVPLAIFGGADSLEMSPGRLESKKSISSINQIKGTADPQT